ncbi:ribonuclease Z [bacterium]|nr:ribonuclease Z [bacterium]
MEIITLGTGAASPTLERNVAAIALVRNGEILLFDCGEGTQVQFAKAKLSMAKVSKIFITHLHGDHFYGLMPFLTTLQLNKRENPLELFAPKGVKDYVNFMKKTSQTGFSYELKITEIGEDFECGTLCETKDYIVKAMPLSHRIFVLGYSFEEKEKAGHFDDELAFKLGIPFGPIRGKIKNGETVTLENGTVVTPEQIIGEKIQGKKITYCTDTVYFQNSVELAKDSDLLIHEGTFSKDELEKAQQTKHSTTVQAALVAKNSNSKRLLITHISSRYVGESRSLIHEGVKEIFPNYILAKDFMKIEI